jgi:hypothetical protein
VEQTKSYEAGLQTGISEANTHLSVIAAEVADTLDKLRIKERYINSQNDALREEYKQASAPRAGVLRVPCWSQHDCCCPAHTDVYA